VGKRVADFVDLNYVIRAASEDWFASTGGLLTSKNVLVAESSNFARGLIRSGLDMAGYQVLEAANLEEAIRRLEQQPVDIVVAALDLPPNGSSELLVTMRRRAEWENIPMLALVESLEQVRRPSGEAMDFQDCQVKFDRQIMLESVARLASSLAAPKAEVVCG
jgi:CheY-like chemotaxis protein